MDRVHVRRWFGTASGSVMKKLNIMTWMTSTTIAARWTDQVWVGCFVAAAFVFFLRKLILARYGHPFDFLDMDVKDGQRLRRIAEKEQKPNLKRLYNGVNWGFRFLFCLGVSILLLTRIGH